MQRLLALFLLSLAAAAYAQTATTTANKTHRKVTHSAAATSSKGAARTRSITVKGRRSRAKPAPSYQLHPDPERYQQIQQALADRGYFKGQVNGQWGDDSVEAMKKFQGDQKLDTDGKINSLTLIGLGLGPRHDGTSGHDAPIPPPPPPPDNPVPAPPRQ